MRAIPRTLPILLAAAALLLSVTAPASAREPYWTLLFCRHVDAAFNGGGQVYNVYTVDDSGSRRPAIDITNHSGYPKVTMTAGPTDPWPAFCEPPLTDKDNPSRGYLSVQGADSDVTPFEILNTYTSGWQPDLNSYDMIWYELDRALYPRARTPSPMTDLPMNTPGSTVTAKSRDIGITDIDQTFYPFGAKTLLSIPGARKWSQTFIADGDRVVGARFHPVYASNSQKFRNTRVWITEEGPGGPEVADATFVPPDFSSVDYYKLLAVWPLTGANAARTVPGQRYCLNIQVETACNFYLIEGDATGGTPSADGKYMGYGTSTNAKLGFTEPAKRIYVNGEASRDNQPFDAKYNLHVIVMSLKDVDLPTEIKGRVLAGAGDTAVSGAVITVLRQSGVSASTDASGRFLLSGLTGSSRTLVVSAAGFTTVSREVTVLANQTQTIADIRLEPLPCGIRGTVLEMDTNKPIAGATVSAGGQTATTAADGTYELANLIPGEVTLTVTAAGYVERSMTVTVTGGQVAEQGVLMAPAPKGCGCSRGNGAGLGPELPLVMGLLAAYGLGRRRRRAAR